MNILHVASECFPWVKTGGLADVLGALPEAQARNGESVRVLLPAYRGLAQRLGPLQVLAELELRGLRFRLLAARVTEPGSGLCLLDCPALFDRPGDPYHGADGRAHADNGWRFGCFAEAAARLALEGIGGWQPDLVHAHDWQAALVPAWLALQERRPATLLTIHNLAYQGCVDAAEFRALGLPESWWRVEVGEFWGSFSFLKAGISSADALSTVSPQYAREIQTAEFGQGLDGCLRQRGDQLFGILNGIDTALWDPATDPLLVARYDRRTRLAGKAVNKAALQAELGLAPEPERLLVGIVSRLAEQKGIDAVLAAHDCWASLPLQLAVLGGGDARLEQGLADLARQLPGRVAVRLGYDERLAHRIEAGADAFLMPSRFEPCGLNQMYSQRYGTVPLVRAVGGLADTVTDASPAALAAGDATGVRFNHSDAGGVRYALERALELYAGPDWAGLQAAGMARDFSWAPAAQAYQQLYRSLLRRGR
ncbi:MAG: glycogen synthase GlgA [Stagnimonas sp.]|nr:glycogen synthase GlgA [Stagnimonas sp.]